MNTTKLKELWEKVKDFFKNMSTKVRIILCTVVVVIVALIAVLVVMSNNQPYATLFTNLSSSEAGAIIDYLQENGFTDYRLEGDTIYVRADQQDVMVARLVQAGYPKEGYLYDTYFEKSGLTTTNTERNTNLQIALQERLGAIIRNFPGVQEAFVTITPGKDQTYVLEDVQTSSEASVVLVMREGEMLTPEQAAAIRNLVSHSVRDLSLDDVSIEDTIGNTYTADTVANLGDNSELKLALQEYYANQVRTNIVNLLTPIYGAGNVQAAVSCTVDVNRRMVESEEFSQPEGSAENSGLIGTDTILGIVSADGVETVGGIPGTTTNSDIDIPTYMEDLMQAAGDGTYGQWYRNFVANMNKTTEQMEVVAGTVTDIQVSVTINANSPNGTSVEARPLARHVATGAGIGGEDPESRVSVLIAPFYEVPDDVNPDGFVPTQETIALMIIAGAVLLVLLIMLIVILSVSRRKKKKKEAEQAAIDAQLGLIGPDGEPLPDEMVLAGMPGVPGAPGEQPATGADIMELNTEKSMELRKTVRQFAQNNPEIAAQMVKAWLRGEDDNG